jgi:hypothetical protein
MMMMMMMMLAESFHKYTPVSLIYAMSYEVDSLIIQVGHRREKYLPERYIEGIISISCGVEEVKASY